MLTNSICRVQTGRAHCAMFSRDAAQVSDAPQVSDTCLSPSVQEPQDAFAHARYGDRPSAAHRLGRQRSAGVAGCSRLRDDPASMRRDLHRLRGSSCALLQARAESFTANLKPEGNLLSMLQLFYL